MELTFLDPVYARPGPYACAYLDTSRDIPDPESAISLRRRHLRQALAGQGTDDATVAAVADVAGSDREVAGRHGQAIFASQGHLALVEEVPDPPAHDAARFSALPDVMPLAVQHAPWRRSGRGELGRPARARAWRRSWPRCSALR
ncbi:hypothetical protein QFZ66_001031 [Streptomyces sp. B4I13]|uniref:hypothetical protein n=1 Tax=Streptomyces sp. B4I13 TaxID=3042271 RepID=UPI002783DA43|nr:hypothetical protein [Streptomyces sp. B4I13]MDQ0957153.1 hypothetical protein [Streptomyces sp. B4I13]